MLLDLLSSTSTVSLSAKGFSMGAARISAAPIASLPTNGTARATAQASINATTNLGAQGSAQALGRLFFGANIVIFPVNSLAIGTGSLGNLVATASINTQGSSQAFGKAGISPQASVSAIGKASATGQASTQSSNTVLTARGTALSQSSALHVPIAILLAHGQGSAASGGKAQVVYNFIATARGSAAASGITRFTPITFVNANGFTEATGTLIAAGLYAQLLAKGQSIAVGQLSANHIIQLTAQGTATTNSVNLLRSITSMTALGSAQAAGQLNATGSVLIQSTGSSIAQGNAATTPSLTLSAQGLAAASQNSTTPTIAAILYADGNANATGALSVSSRFAYFTAMGLSMAAHGGLVLPGNSVTILSATGSAQAVGITPIMQYGGSDIEDDDVQDATIDVEDFEP